MATRRSRRPHSTPAGPFWPGAGTNVPFLLGHGRATLEVEAGGLLVGGYGPSGKGVMATMWYPGWGWGGFAMMAVLFVLFVAVVIIAGIALVRYLRGSRQSGAASPPGEPEREHGQERAEELLAERFARGEIDEDEYKRRLELLRTGR